MLIWKWMIQNTYLPSYLSWRWMDLPPTIMILYVSPNCYYVSPNVHKHQTMESRQISNTYLPRMLSHTSFALEVSHHGKMCQMNVSSLSFVIVLMAIDISMSHAKNWKRLVQYVIISQCCYTCFCFDHTSSESNFELPCKTGSWVEFTIRSSYGIPIVVIESSAN
jgi:hypothetical protein